MHSRYRRTLADPAIGGRQTLLRVRIRRFFCDNTACRRRTFAEQVPGLTTPYARRTPLLRGILEKIALALGDRPGARMTRLLAVEVSRTTLLRLVRAPPAPEVEAVARVRRNSAGLEVLRGGMRWSAGRERQRRPEVPRDAISWTNACQPGRISYCLEPCM